MRVAAQLALPLRRVHPNRARAFAQATGRLAKSDVIQGYHPLLNSNTVSALTRSHNPEKNRARTQFRSLFLVDGS